MCSSVSVATKEKGVYCTFTNMSNQTIQHLNSGNTDIKEIFKDHCTFI